MTIGETVIWTRRLSDYLPADGWVLDYYFRGPGPGFDIVATTDTVDGTRFAVEAVVEAVQEDPPAEPPLALVAGEYFWQSWVTSGDERHKVGEGRTIIKVDFADAAVATPLEGRSPLEIQLAAVRVALGTVVAKNKAEYQLGDRMKREHPLSDLIDLEKRLVELVNQERRAARVRKGGPVFQTIRSRFV